MLIISNLSVIHERIARAADLPQPERLGRDRG